MEVFYCKKKQSIWKIFSIWKCFWAGLKFSLWAFREACPRYHTFLTFEGFHVPFEGFQGPFGLPMMSRCTNLTGRFIIVDKNHKEITHIYEIMKKNMKIYVKKNHPSQRLACDFLTRFFLHYTMGWNLASADAASLNGPSQQRFYTQLRPCIGMGRKGIARKGVTRIMTRKGITGTTR